MSERTFPQLAATVLINEILPRDKKFKKKIEASIAGQLVAMEFHRVIDRRQLRKILDVIYKDNI